MAISCPAVICPALVRDSFTFKFRLAPAARLWLLLKFWLFISKFWSAIIFPVSFCTVLAVTFICPAVICPAFCTVSRTFKFTEASLPVWIFAWPSFLILAALISTSFIASTVPLVFTRSWFVTTASVFPAVILPCSLSTVWLLWIVKSPIANNCPCLFFSCSLVISKVPLVISWPCWLFSSCFTSKLVVPWPICKMLPDWLFMLFAVTFKFCPLALIFPWVLSSLSVTICVSSVLLWSIAPALLFRFCAFRLIFALVTICPCWLFKRLALRFNSLLPACRIVPSWLFISFASRVKLAAFTVIFPFSLFILSWTLICPAFSLLIFMFPSLFSNVSAVSCSSLVVSSALVVFTFWAVTFIFWLA